MSQGSRPDRVADQIRAELAALLARDVHDPGIGFVTITRVQMTPDLQQARVFYTALGDEKSRRQSERTLHRALPFLRRQIGARLRLKRVPELKASRKKSRWRSHPCGSGSPPRRRGPVKPPRASRR